MPGTEGMERFTMNMYSAATTSPEQVPRAVLVRSPNSWVPCFICVRSQLQTQAPKISLSPVGTFHTLEALEACESALFSGRVTDSRRQFGLQNTVPVEASVL